MPSIYLTIAVRSFLKHRSHTAINILGLAIAIAASVLTVLYVKYEWTYDGHHRYAPHIFRVINGNNARTPGAPATLLKRNYPEVAHAVRIRTASNKWLVTYGDTEAYEDRIYWTESSLFDVFTVPLVKGNPETALEGQYKAVLSESMAGKYFGDENPMGKVMRLDDMYDFTITGVMEDFPGNTHFPTNMLLSFHPYDFDRMENNWWESVYYTYLRLHDGTSAPGLASKFQSFVDAEIRSTRQQEIQDFQFDLQPMSSIHLHSNLLNELESNSSVAYVYTLITGAAFLLLIACVNFINLSMVHATARVKEAGLMNVFGAGRRRIVMQHLAGSLLISGLNLALAVLLVLVSLPAFNSLTGKTLTLGLAGQGDIWLGMIAVAVLTGIVSGGGIALVLSGSRPTDALSNRLSPAIDFPSIKRMLVTAQFCMSAMLIVSTGVVYSQLRYMLDQPVGFEKSDVIVIPLILGVQFEDGLRRPSEAFESELFRSPNIAGVSTASYVPGLPPARGSLVECMIGGVDERNASVTTFMRVLTIDHDFFQTLGMDLVFGSYPRPLDMKTYSPYGEKDVYLNETAVRHLGWPSPEAALDRSIDMIWPIVTLPGRVAGVVEDIHFQSLFHPVEPMLYMQGGGEHMIVRTQPGNAEPALDDLERIWRSNYPDVPMIYSYLEDNIDRLYEPVERLGAILVLCALLATLLTFFGLFNLVSLTLRQRSKEIGVRKILGARVSQVVWLLSKEFTVMAGVASIVAWPIAYLVMIRWLQDFAYRTAPSAALFMLVGLAVVVVATVSVGVFVLKEARANPVEALRYE